MPRINSIVISLMAALSAILAIASPIDKSYPLDTTNTPTPAVNARDDPVPKNGWMEWYLNGVDGAVQTQGWTSDTCQPVPDASTTHWTTDHTDRMAPAPGFHAYCRVVENVDCTGAWGHWFTSDSIATSDVFGRGHYKPYYAFWCTCDDKCKVLTDSAELPMKIAAITSTDHPPRLEPAAADPV